ncbi:hypothetical protein V6N13_091549 [Hibiscus sabdariffa]|uniref:Uncharacterized protein n=1 Tax=Hibiscus sabdariffa TaxID=183260 RepID=A0ABR2QE96_9ROSI
MINGNGALALSSADLEAMMHPRNQGFRIWAPSTFAAYFTGAMLVRSLSILQLAYCNNFFENQLFLLRVYERWSSGLKSASILFPVN